MKTSIFSIIAIILSASVSSGVIAAAEKVNSKESLRECKSAMEADLSEGVSYKFKRKTATTVEIDRYKHWINLYEVSNLGKDAKKLLCETSRSGEVLVLKVQPGSWRI